MNLDVCEKYETERNVQILQSAKRATRDKNVPVKWAHFLFPFLTKALNILMVFYRFTEKNLKLPIQIYRLHTSANKNVEFVLEKIGVISKVVFPVESKSGLRNAPAHQVFE